MVIQIHLYFEFSYIPFYVVSKNNIGENKIVFKSPYDIYIHNLSNCRICMKDSGARKQGISDLPAPSTFPWSLFLYSFSECSSKDAKVTLSCPNYIIRHAYDQCRFCKSHSKDQPISRLEVKQEVLKTNILVICLESQQNETNISDL